MKSYARKSKLRIFVSFVSLLLLSSAFAQGPVAGYTFLGSCGGHNYYITNDYYRGSLTAAVVTDFRNKTVVPDNNVYVTSIGTSTENTCITNFLLAYNIAKYGGDGKTNPQNGGDPHNAWIGLTDAALENQFVWSNGQSECADFRNWNIREPNNFNNGEDWTQLLLMRDYDDNGPVQPLGKWNDWFDTYLPVIIEVGPADCELRANNGCSHGYWKNAETFAWSDAGYDRSNIFSDVFGVTNGRGVITPGATTLQQGLELTGGGYNQVAKQGVAALLNAGQGFFPYSVNDIKTAVQSIFNNGFASLPAVAVNGTTYTGGSFTSSNTLASYLDMLNNLGCPINHQGERGSASIMGMDEKKGMQEEKQFDVAAYPNPTRNSFSIQVNGLSTEKIALKVTDITGRVVEQRAGITANQVLTIGSDYRAGMYNVLVIQGANTKQLKLVKQ